MVLWHWKTHTHTVLRRHSGSVTPGRSDTKPCGKTMILTVSFTSRFFSTYSVKSMAPHHHRLSPVRGKARACSVKDSGGFSQISQQWWEKTHLRARKQQLLRIRCASEFLPQHHRNKATRVVIWWILFIEHRVVGSLDFSRRTAASAACDSDLPIV